MSTDLLVIVDDNSGAISYTGEPISNWSLITESTSWYGATLHAGYHAAFNFTFNGTSAAFIGITPSSSSIPRIASVQIDDGIPSPIDYGPETDTTYKQWFVTPTLLDGRHTVIVSDMLGTFIDYAVVKVAAQTPLTGQTVIVDDDSPLIQYSGQWSRNTSALTPGPAVGLTMGYPYGNVTHHSSNPGDTFTFRFSGTSIAVYGIFSWRNLGSLTATYSIDGTPHSATVSVNTSSPRYLDGSGEVPNYLYFSLDNLLSAPHTLLVNVTEANNHNFVLDYITYKPAFGTLASMPSLSSGISSTTTPSSSVTASGSHRSISTGAIVGIAFGGTAFGVLMAILVMWFILRRRRARGQVYPDAALGSGVNDPNMLSAS